MNKVSSRILEPYRNEASSCTAIQQTASSIIRDRLYQLKEAAENVEKLAFGKLSTVMVSDSDECPSKLGTLRPLPDLFAQYDDVISQIFNVIDNIDSILNRVDI